MFLVYQGLKHVTFDKYTGRLKTLNFGREKKLNFEGYKHIYTIFYLLIALNLCLKLIFYTGE